MKKIKTLIIIISIIGSFMTCCDPVIGYEYYINNQSDSLIYVYFHGIGSRRTRNDTTITIKPLTENMFFQTGLIGSNPHDEGELFLKVFDTLSIQHKNGIPLKTSFNKRENWKYSNEISHFGLIKTGVNKYTLDLNNDLIK
jgi:hypothetical protein